VRLAPAFLTQAVVQQVLVTLSIISPLIARGPEPIPRSSLILNSLLIAPKADPRQVRCDCVLGTHLHMAHVAKSTSKKLNK
jgi:hypothetical protein